MEMVHLDRDTPRTSRRKSLFFETVRYFRKDDIARRFVELFPPFGFAEVFVVFFLILMISVSILRATDNLSPVWASYASWSPAFVSLEPSIEKQHRGMVLAFAAWNRYLGYWTRRTATDSLSTEDVGVLIFVSTGVGVDESYSLHHITAVNVKVPPLTSFPHHKTLNAYRTTGSTLLTLCQR